MTSASKHKLSLLGITATLVALASLIAWQGHRLFQQLGDLQTSSPELATAATQSALFIAILACITALVGALALGTALSQRLTKPIHNFEQAAAAFREGKLDYRVDSCSDKFGVIGTTFNEMADRLQTTLGELDQARENLDNRVKQRAVDLEHAHKRLRQTQFDLVQHEKMNMLGHLAAGMAHEVNTPTAAILNAAVDIHEHLLEFLTLALNPDQLPAETRQWLLDVFESLFNSNVARSETAARKDRRRVERQLREAGYDESRRMAEVVVAYGMAEQIHDRTAMAHLSHAPVLSALEHALTLKVSAEISEASARKIARIVRSLRFYAHDSHKDISDVDVNESIENTLVILQGRIKHLAEVHTQLDEDLPPARCGADLLQVWTNILSNACDAIEEAGREGLSAIEISSSLADDHVVVTISNEGDPIPEHVLPKIFDPFFTTKSVGKGTGLGLGICTTILDRWGATIQARNDPGRVTFEVSLPFRSAQDEKTFTGEALLENASASPTATT